MFLALGQRSPFRGCFILLLAVFSLRAAAAPGEVGDWNARYQATYIRQQKDAFDAPYSGPHSLTAAREQSYTLTATAFLGIRPWRDGALYIDPEVSQGHALSNLTGLGGFTNGEMARTSGPDLKLYRARIYLQQNWNLGGESDAVESGPNQLPDAVDRHRLTLTIGNLSLLDIFDSNRYAHDGRAQFENWALITYGAYDFAADSRGYTWAAIAELHEDAWAFRFGRALLPKEPNGLALDTHVFQHYGDQLEIERDYQYHDWPGTVRLLAYRDRAVLARYSDALSLAATTNTTPDINAVRDREHNKVGIGISVEQAISDSAGVFARVMRADGETETEAYATIDQSLSVGIVSGGRFWHRAQDTIGFAYAWNAVSAQNQKYLAAGGLGFFIGDGRLRYGPEQIAEVYYNVGLVHGVWLTADLQHVTNPAYSRDRGPVTVPSLRLHTEF
jgi:hypothetical protein